MKVRKYKLPTSYTNLWMKFKDFCAYLYSYTLIGYVLVLFHTFKGKKSKYKYEISLCLIFKNEVPYLREWIEYHKLIGIEHFYLYNNLSDDNYMKELETYLMDRSVTLIDWPKPYSQLEAYHDCYIKSRKETHWLGYLDIDEFLNLNVNIGNNIKDILNRYRFFPSLHLFWRMFGTTGIMKEDYSKPIIEQFTSCWPWLTNEGKYFINNDWDFNKITVHWAKAKYFKLPVFPITDYFVFTPFMSVYPRSGKYKPKIYINHYWSKSREFSKYKNYKKSDAVAKSNEEIRKRNGINFFELQYSEKDYSIQRWLILLKKLYNY